MSTDAARWLIWSGVAAQIVGLLMARFDLGRRLGSETPGRPSPSAPTSPSLAVTVTDPDPEDAPDPDRQATADATPTPTRGEPAARVAVEAAGMAVAGDEAMREMRRRHERLAAARDRDDRVLRRIWRGLAITGAGVLVTAGGVVASGPEPSIPEDDPPAVSQSEHAEEPIDEPG